MPTLYKNRASAEELAHYFDNVMAVVSQRLIIES
jgi:hypothetical protein